MAESSYSIYFDRDLSAPAMSTDVSQVRVALFPSFQNIFFYQNANMYIVFVFVSVGWSLLPNALRPFKICCAPPNLDITRK